MADRLIGICTNLNGEGVWWPAKSVDEGCIQECDCEPDFYVAEIAIEQEVERLELDRKLGRMEIGAVEMAIRLRSLLQDTGDTAPRKEPGG